METQRNLNSGDTLAVLASIDAAPRHIDEYQQFIEWIALPVKERSPKTQKELAVGFGLSEWTLSQWKLREGFWGQVEAVRKSWGKSKTPEVMNALYQESLTGNPAAIKLWMQIMEGFAEKSKSDINAVHANFSLTELLDQMQSDPDTTLKPSLANGSPGEGR